MATLNNFDASTVAPAVGFEPIPDGTYPATIVASEMKLTQKGTGHYLELEFEVVEGPFKDRKVWTRLNLDNPSDQAVRIARGELSAICHAVGVMKPADSAALHNIPLRVKVACVKRSDTDDMTNVIKGYHPATADVQQPEPTSDKAPWEE